MAIPQISSIFSSYPPQAGEQPIQEQQTALTAQEPEPITSPPNLTEQEMRTAQPIAPSAFQRFVELKGVSQRTPLHRQPQMEQPDLPVEEKKEDEQTEQEMGAAGQRSPFAHPISVESEVLQQRQVVPISSETKQQDRGQQEALNPPSPYIGLETIKGFVNDNNLDGLIGALEEKGEYLKNINKGKDLGSVLVNTLFRVYELKSLNPPPQRIGEFICYLKNEIETIMQNVQKGSEAAKKSVTTEIEKDLYAVNEEMRSLALKINYLANNCCGKFCYHFADSYGHCERTSKASTLSLAGVTGVVTSIIGLTAAQQGTSAYNASIIGMVSSLIVGLFPIGYLAVKACRKKM